MRIKIVAMSVDAVPKFLNSLSTTWDQMYVTACPYSSESKAFSWKCVGQVVEVLTSQHPEAALSLWWVDTGRERPQCCCPSSGTTQRCSLCCLPEVSEGAGSLSSMVICLIIHSLLTFFPSPPQFPTSLQCFLRSLPKQFPLNSCPKTTSGRTTKGFPLGQ